MKKCGTAQPRASGWDVVESCRTFSWNSFHNPASSGRLQHLTFAAFQQPEHLLPVNARKNNQAVFKSTAIDLIS